ncbi:Nramp family divalent metal transporter [Desulfurobacterium atlanticum]|uniref:NRAMP (Natural resistance-associated macrophage protein) metal ion transporters n=1 Tax=Desulfurobacterium atlanticum TaxID=240169 RepID=A0A238ZSL2_9BACT|nr:Nramp family divalent metal transporter [Desulfurobacterium atlanticum]SNR86122.1 NRAMP (natural resistance-associated macrophage protein) metal ion transporters [Desulfurobacterium atlanticum]
MKLKYREKRKLAAARRNFNRFIPGLITGGSGNDPAGIVTYTAVGATTGYSLLWLLLLSTPMMIEVQNMAAKLAVVTEKSLPEIIKSIYSKKVTIFIVTLLVIVNIITIGADLQGLSEILAIITNSKAVYFDAPLTALIAYLVIFRSYRTVKKVLVFFSSILSVYIISAIVAKPDIGKMVINTFIPHIKANLSFIIAALGLLGTTISPYLLFWQSSQEREEQKTVVQVEEVKLGTVVGMVYSNLVAYAIIVAAAAEFFGKNVKLDTVKDAALALKPFAGEYAFALFSIGIIFSGLLAIPVLAGSAAYAVANTFGWREGLKNRVSDAKGFYAVFFGALVIGSFMQFFSISTVDALYYSQVLDGILIPIIVGILLLLCNKKELLGKYTNGIWSNVFGFITFFITAILSVIMVYQMVSGK